MINDFIIPYRIDMQGDPHIGRQFYIKYDVATGAYMIRDLQIGFGVFQKLEFGQCRLP